MIHEYDVGEMVEHNIEQTTNDSLNLGNTEMKKVYFYGSKKCIDVFDVHIKKKKRNLMHLHMAKAKKQMQNTLFIEVPQTIRYQNAYEKNNIMKFVTNDKKITRKI